MKQLDRFRWPAVRPFQSTRVRCRLLSVHVIDEKFTKMEERKLKMEKKLYFFI